LIPRHPHKNGWRNRDVIPLKLCCGIPPIPRTLSHCSPEHFRPLTIVQLFTRIYASAGIAGASSHSGRRQFITALAESKVNVRVIQALARHRTLNTTRRYIDVNDTKLENAVEVVNF
jgi:integrase